MGPVWDRSGTGLGPVWDRVQQRQKAVFHQIALLEVLEIVILKTGNRQLWGFSVAGTGLGPVWDQFGTDVSPGQDPVDQIGRGGRVPGNIY